MIPVWAIQLIQIIFGKIFDDLLAILREPDKIAPTPPPSYGSLDIPNVDNDPYGVHGIHY